MSFMIDNVDVCIFVDDEVTTEFLVTNLYPGLSGTDLPYKYLENIALLVK